MEMEMVKFQFSSVEFGVREAGKVHKMRYSAGSGSQESN